MNRDEAYDRPEANSLHFADGDSQAVFPQDLRAGGTWCGANKYGVALGLLNRYQDPHEKRDAVSRGLIIPRLLTLNSIASIQRALDKQQLIELDNFHPFDLLIATQGRALLLSWNGKERHWTEFGESFFLSSSALRTTEVIAHRQMIFQSLRPTLQQDSNAAAASVLTELHLAESPDPSVGIRMRRAHTHTKSVCQVVLQNERQVMSYWTHAALDAFDRKRPFDNALRHDWRQFSMPRHAASLHA